MEHMSDVTKVYTVTLPTGQVQVFEETPEGVFYANSSSRCTSFAAGLEKAKALGATVVEEVLKDGER